MKQSAVEYLAEKLLENQTYDKDGYVIIDLSVEHLEYLVQRAKEMEKEQIIDAHGNKLKKSRDTGNYEYWFSGEDYYNKTFKTN
jgi:hypothetical protein